MIEWHESLKKLRAEQKKLQLDNQSDKDLLANLENRQEMQRVDVERMRQRAQIKRKIEMLEHLRPVIQYREARNELNQKKTEQRRLRKELEDLEAELAPALRAVNVKQDYCSKLDEVVKYKKRCFEQADRDAMEIVKKIEQFDDALKDLNNQIEAEKKQARVTGSKRPRSSRRLTGSIASSMNNRPSLISAGIMRGLWVRASSVIRTYADCLLRKKSVWRPESLRRKRLKFSKLDCRLLKSSSRRTTRLDEQSNSCRVSPPNLGSKKPSFVRHHEIRIKLTSGCKTIRISLRRKFSDRQSSPARSKTPNMLTRLSHYYKERILLPSPRRLEMTFGPCKEP